jgi:hypothetical protein
MLEWESDTPPTPSDIRKARRQRLAELEISGETGLVIQGKEYMKDDIIKLFDSMLTDEFFAYHFQVKQDAALLQFLETGVYTRRHPFSTDMYRDESFAEWIQPYFARAFAVLLKNVIENNTAGNAIPGDLAALLQEKLKLNEQYKVLAWQPLCNKLQNSVSTMELYRRTRENLTLESTMELSKIPFLQLLSLKPSGLFYDELCEYIRLLYNQIVQVIGDTQSVSPAIYCILHNLRNIKFEDSLLQQTCEEVHKIFSSYQKHPNVIFIRTDMPGVPEKWAVFTDDKTTANTTTANTTIVNNLFGLSGCVMYFFLIAGIIVWIFLLHNMFDSHTTYFKMPKMPEMPEIQEITRNNMFLFPYHMDDYDADSMLRWEKYLIAKIEEQRMLDSIKRVSDSLRIKYLETLLDSLHTGYMKALSDSLQTERMKTLSDSLRTRRIRALSDSLRMHTKRELSPIKQYENDDNE